MLTLMERKHIKRCLDLYEKSVRELSARGIQPPKDVLDSVKILKDALKEK